MAAITKYFVGGEVEAFVTGAPATLTWSTAAGTYDSNFARGSVQLISTSGQYIPTTFTSGQTTFSHTYHEYRVASGVGSPAASQAWSAFVNGSLAQQFRIMGIGGNEIQPVIQFQHWNGSSWVAATGTALVAPTNTLHRFDFTFNGAGGTASAWMDGIPLGSFTGLTIPSMTQCQNYITSVGGPSNQINLSEVYTFDVSTLGRRLATLGETANGTNSQWTGSVTDINEVGTFNDANFIQTGSANQVSTFVNSLLSTVAQQYVVSGLIIAGRILIGAVGPQNLKGAVVVGGVNYYSTANVANLLTSFGYTWADFPNNPATGLDWTVGTINTPIETGWQSLA